MKQKTTSLILAKQNFKFSSAHFLIFDASRAEKLHGHNYRVKVKIGLPDEAEFKEQGYFLDFNVFKKFIKEACDAWDERVLLPELHQDMKIQKKAQRLEVSFRERFYVFPVDEVVLLPITNTSVEQISRLLAESFAQKFSNKGLRFVEFYVEETAGQGASYKLSLC